jgi:hypothetical protein
MGGRESSGDNSAKAAAHAPQRPSFSSQVVSLAHAVHLYLVAFHLPPWVPFHLPLKEPFHLPMPGTGAPPATANFPGHDPGPLVGTAVLGALPSRWRPPVAAGAAAAFFFSMYLAILASFLACQAAISAGVRGTQVAHPGILHSCACADAASIRTPTAIIRPVEHRMLDMTVRDRV